MINDMGKAESSSLEWPPPQELDDVNSSDGETETASSTSNGYCRPQENGRKAEIEMSSDRSGEDGLVAAINPSAAAVRSFVEHFSISMIDDMCNSPATRLVCGHSIGPR